MRPFLAALRWDLVTAYRYGFWVAGIVVTVVWAGIFLPLSLDYRQLWLPVVLYSDIATMGSMFIAGILFFERSQGTIDAVVVSPLTTSAWLLSKLLSLSLLTTSVTLALAFALFGRHAPWPKLAVAIAMSSFLFVLFGFLLAARFKTVSNFLMSSIVLSTLTGLPVLEYFEIWSHALIWLLPFQPSLVMIEHALTAGPSWRFWGAAAALLGWIALGFWASLRAFHREISYRRGAV